jgi:hypothetical protein
MLKRLGQSLSIGVARDGLTLLRLARWSRAAPAVLAERALQAGEIDHAESLGAALRALLADQQLAGLPLSVVLADDLVRLWQVMPPQGAARMADLEAACTLRFQVLYGESLANWQLASAPDARAPFLAAAMPRHLFDACRQLADEFALALVEVAPQCIKSFNRWCGQLHEEAWFAQVHAGLLTLGAHDGHRLLAMRSTPLPPQAGLDWLREHTLREALRLNLAPPQGLQACGQVPQAWLEADAGFVCSRLEQARRGMPAPSNGAALALSGARA